MISIYFVIQLVPLTVISGIKLQLSPLQHCNTFEY